MDNTAPVPSGIKGNSAPKAAETTKSVDHSNPSVVSVTIAACGGCGINLSRPFKEDKQTVNVMYFDTSMANTRGGEQANIVTSGSGSGSDRSSNASDIEKAISRFSPEEMGDTDILVVVFALGGGSGSVIGPLLIREAHRRGKRVVAVAVADSSASVTAKNSLNTLKTLSAICKNNDLYLPMILLSNDQTNIRGQVDAAANAMMGDLVDLLTKPVYEVDRNDRLNWINPSKVIGAQSGIKLIAFQSDKVIPNEKVVLGRDSTDMVDSLLILQDNADLEVTGPDLPPSRLKKMGFYGQSYRRIVGSVTSDVTSVEQIIDFVEKMQNQERAQKTQSVDRLQSNNGDDLIL